MSSLIESVEAFALRIPRPTPYLGPLENGVAANDRRVFTRLGNRSIYSLDDNCLLVKVTTRDGASGWGECVTVVAPQVARAVVQQILGPLACGRDPLDVLAIYEDLYDAMRRRGYFGGFYLDAIAALDIAIWDVRGKLLGVPACKLLGARRRDRIPAYVSGLPCPDLEARAALAKQWVDKGFDALKFAAAVADQGEYLEMKAIREAVGPGVKIMADLHYRYTAEEAIRLIKRLEEFDLFLAETPVHPEDIDGLGRVARSVATPVAMGEELRTVHEYLPRFRGRCMGIIQPEMGRAGLTGFWDICRAANMFHCKVMPHASIGIGIFQAASLQASAALPEIDYHEYQPSIFDKNVRFVTGNMKCESGYFVLPDGPGLGVEPRDEVFQYVISN